MKLTNSLLRALLAAGIGGFVAFAILTWMPGIAGSLIAAVLGALLGVAAAALIIRPDLKKLGQL